MIARIWRGRTRAEYAGTYLDYLRQTGLSDYRSIDGNQGVRVLRRVDGEQAEFLLISLWESYEAIEAFAGPAYERAVYYPEDDDYLLEKEPGVRHYEIVFDDPPG